MENVNQKKEITLTCVICNKPIILSSIVYEEILHSIKLGKPMHIECAFKEKEKNLG